MKLCVVGTGYVGLVAGTCFAEGGNDVICIENVSEGRLSFSTDLADAVRRSIVCFIAVGTPSGEDGSADLRNVMDVAREIGRTMNGYRVVVAKSTVPVGTSARIREAVASATTQPFDVV